MVCLLPDTPPHEPVAISMPMERTTEYGISVGNTVAWLRVPAVLIPFLCQMFVPAASQGLVLNTHEQIVEQLTSRGWLVSGTETSASMSSPARQLLFVFILFPRCRALLVSSRIHILGTFLFSSRHPYV